MDKKNLLVLVCFIFHLTAYGVTVAIIDSGVDLKHRTLAGQAWHNPGEIPDNGRDEDHNGYQDDLHGWNFAEDNDQLIDRDLVGSFSKQPYRYLEIMAKTHKKKATPEDKVWMEAVKADKEAMAEIRLFVNFIHGTHVAGIAARGAVKNHILPIKLLATTRGEENLETQRTAVRSDLGIKLIKRVLDFVSRQQMLRFYEISLYLAGHQAQVANGSFGISVPLVKKLITLLFKISHFRQPSAEELRELSHHYLSQLKDGGEQMVGFAPDTLFVFAAGNDAADNDQAPPFPSSVRSPNSLSVAATDGSGVLASFSNYGARTVEMAAPGVGIHSLIPGDASLPASGTSQAAPAVTNIAGQIREINPALSPAQTKEILMATVDKKVLLQDKVVSGGVLNGLRAVEAARLSQDMPVTDACIRARTLIQDQVFDLASVALAREQGGRSLPVHGFFWPLLNPFPFKDYTDYLQRQSF